VIAGEGGKFTLAKVEAGQTRSFEIEAIIDPAFQGKDLTIRTIKTKASDSPGGEAVEDSNPDDDQVDLPPYSPRSKVQFTVTLHNQGSLDAFDIDIVERVPKGLSAPILVGEQEGINAGEGGKFTIAQVKAGESKSFQLEAVIAPDYMGRSLVMEMILMTQLEETIRILSK